MHQIQQMRKIQLLLVFIIISSLAIGQIGKGAFFTGGQFNYNKRDYNGNTNTRIHTSGVLGFSLGKAVKENNIIGFYVSFSPSVTTLTSTGAQSYSYRTNSYSLGTFGRNYRKLSSKAFFFTQGDLGFYHTRSKTKGNNISIITTKNRGGYLSFSPGISYLLSDRLHMEISIPSIGGISYSINESFDPTTGNSQSKEENFTMFSNLSTATSLNWLGVGFRVIL